MKLEDLNHPLIFALAIVLIAASGTTIMQYFTHSKLPGVAQVSRKA